MRVKRWKQGVCTGTWTNETANNMFFPFRAVLARTHVCMYVPAARWSEPLSWLSRRIHGSTWHRRGALRLSKATAVPRPKQRCSHHGHPARCEIAARERGNSPNNSGRFRRDNLSPSAEQRNSMPDHVSLRGGCGLCRLPIRLGTCR